MSRESLSYLWFALGVVTLIGVAHSIYDIHLGTPWHLTLVPLTVLTLQTVILTLGYWYMRSRGARRNSMLWAGAAVSVLLGCLSFLAHPEPTMGVVRALAHGAPFGLAIGGFWALLFLVPTVLRESHLRRVAAERALREAELAQLRSSLQPHFLLNTLHAIAALVVDEPLVARRLLAALGDLLRDALEPAAEMRPLETDLAWLRAYAEILEVRHSGQLSFEWDVAPDTTLFPLPRLLLQPLVENAVKHGALQRTGGGIVSVRTRFVDAGLELVVEDNGPGISGAPKDGLGLRIVRERLALAHGGASLCVDSSSQGTRATIRIPLARQETS